MKISIYFGLLFVISSSLSQTSSPLCNVEGVYAELNKAIHLLKTKQEKLLAANSQVLRQEDDDDDVPYYVPAIGKVIGSILAQNATNAIEESFGFIPPEINKNIRQVLGLVAETVHKLRPTKPTTTTSAPAVAAGAVPESESGGDAQTPNPQAVAEIEALIAYALAQQIAANLSNSEQDVSVPEANVLIPNEATTTVLPVLSQEIQLVNNNDNSRFTDEPSAPSTAELFSTTFKYPEIKVPVKNNEIVESSEGLAVYAPAYAPNYVETPSTEKIPVYAPAFEHHSYTVTPKSESGPRRNGTSTSASSSTDESSADGTTDNPVTATTTDDDDDEDYEEEN